MRRRVLRAIVAGMSAFAISAVVLCLATPASAFGGFHGGMGFRPSLGGMGGFRPAFGGFHSGFVGVHPGFRPGFVGVHPGFRQGFAAFHPGFAGRRVFHPGFWRHGVWFPGWWAPVVVGGAWWGGGCWTYQPVYDAAGNYLGYASVNICS